MFSTVIAIMIFPMMVIYTFLHKYDKDKFSEVYFSKEQTTTLKGIMILVVFFHHYSQMVPYSEWIERAFRGGQYCIGVFFFLAGFTTCFGYLRSNEIDLKKVWQNRCWRLYLPLAIFSIWINNFLAGLLFFFIITDISFKLCSDNKRRLFLIFLGNILFVVLCICIRPADAWWYDDVWTYFLGAGFAMYKDKVIRFFTGVKYWIFLVCFLLLFAVANYYAFNWRYYVIMTMISSTSGALFIFLLIMKANIRSRFFAFLGVYSYEIFILHKAMIATFLKLFSHNSLILISSLVCSVAIGALLQKMAKYLRIQVNMFSVRGKKNT